MQRETLEEIGIRIKKENLKIVHVMQRKAPDRESIEYFIACQKYEGKIEIMEKNNRHFSVHTFYNSYAYKC